jgi:hypothetical protein
MYVPDWEYEVPTEPSSEPMKFSVSVYVVYIFTPIWKFKFIFRNNLTSYILVENVI